MERFIMGHDGSSSVFVFVDLDDSLFNSLRKCQPGVHLQAAALLSNGEVVSYTSPAQRALIQWLHLGAHVIPVTARSMEGYARVLVDFHGPAIVSFGAIILNQQGQPDAQWQQRMALDLLAAKPLLQEACESVLQHIAQEGIDAWAKVVEELGQMQYLLLKHRSADAQALARISDFCLKPWAAHRPGWRVFQNDNNLTLLPPALDKAHAVEYLMNMLRAEHGHIVTVGMGDSLSDSGFLSLCDYAMAPKGTQLAQRLLIGGA
jgi:hydroxymethylpyrimidine pyrophosphatase-like HAD family hydrolase